MDWLVKESEPSIAASLESNFNITTIWITSYIL